MRRRAALVLLSLALVAPPAAAQDGGCLTAPDDLGAAKPPHALRFGITPQIAGTAGTSQGDSVPEDDAKGLDALRALRPPGRELVLRLNRLFESEGIRGIAAFANKVDAYASAGFTSEVQVRYHPSPAQEGDMESWEAFVREAVTTLGRKPAVVAFSITNEANFPISENTSDGNFDGALDAIVRGIVAGRAALDAIRRTDVPVGFTVAWRYLPNADVNFWKGIGARADATPRFRTALGYVGVQLYPGLVWPPVPLPGRDAGLETRDALAIIRTCHMPLAGLGPGIPLWISENGYATNLGRDEAGQQANLTATMQGLHEVTGTLNVTDYRYFNLRDNKPGGTDLFDAVGLLRSDYTRKPAFATLKDAITRLGTPPAVSAAERRAHRRARRPRRGGGPRRR